MSKKSMVVSGMGFGLGMLTIADQVRTELGVDDDTFHKLSTEASREDWKRLFQGMVCNTYLKSLETIIDIGPVPNTTVKEQFTAFASSTFVQHCAEDSSISEGESGLNELVRDARFQDIWTPEQFDQVSGHPNDVRRFCANHKEKLRQDGYATFFPYKIGKDRFVAFVFVDSGGSLCVGVYRFGFVHVWLAEYRHRVVLPRLAVTQAA